MKTTFFRLGEHKIIQAGGALWWEAHTGVGAFKTGRCFVRGNILFLGPSEREEPGYLKREFLESLQALPQWGHTRYYCSTYSMNECRSGRTLTEEEMFEWAGSQTKKIQFFDKMEPGTSAAASYRLGQHEITQKDGQWRWRTYSGSGRIREGRCIVESGILFLGTGQTEESGDLKHAFIERLRQLPEWRATSLYCPSCAVYDCNTGENIIREKPGVLLDGTLRPRHVLERLSKRSFAAPSLPSSTVQHTPFIHSAPSLLKELEKLAGKAGRAVHRKIHDPFLKHKRGLKKRFDKTRCQIWAQRFSIKKWIAWSGAVVLMAGLLLLIFLHDLWENREHHHVRHDHSSGRHREH